MAYRVVSRFFHRASGAYIDPGQDCPLLPAEDAARLLRARCLVEIRDDPPPSGNGAASRRRSSEKRQEAPPPSKE